MLEDGFDFVGDARELLHEVRGYRGSELAADLREVERGEHQRGELAGEGFGGGDADFRAGVSVDRAIGFAREHGADDVADAQNFRAFVARFAHGREGVGGFTGLADGDDQIFLADDGIAIAEFAAVVHFDGNVRQALDHELAGERGVPTGAAGDDLDGLKILKFLLADVHLVEKDFAGFLRNSAEQRVAHGARLFEDFLLHEMLEAALFGHDGVPGDVLGGTIDGMALKIHEADALRREDGDFAIAEEEDAAGVLQNRGNVAGDEEFVFAEADDDGRAEARGDDFVRIARGERYQRVRAAHHFYGFQDGFFERCAFGIFFDQVRDDFGVCFGDEFVAFGDELVLQLEIIFDDAVVDDDDFAGAVAVRVRVFFGGAAVRGPAGVADAVDAVERSDADGFFEILQLAGGAADFELPSACTTAMPAES